MNGRPLWSIGRRARTMREFGLLRAAWAAAWLRGARIPGLQRVSMRVARWGWPPYYGQRPLARLAPGGYISPSARIAHPGLHLGRNVYVGDRAIIFGSERESNPGSVDIGEGVCLYDGVTIQTAQGGRVRIGDRTTVQPECQFSALFGDIVLGERVQIAPRCAFYPYDHGIVRGLSIVDQALTTKGGILVGDNAWLGYGVIVLDGVTIGEGAVIGAGSVVTRNIPANVVAVGNPARIVKERSAPN